VCGGTTVGIETWFGPASGSVRVERYGSLWRGTCLRSCSLLSASTEPGAVYLIFGFVNTWLLSSPSTPVRELLQHVSWRRSAGTTGGQVCCATTW